MNGMKSSVAALLGALLLSACADAPQTAPTPAEPTVDTSENVAAPEESAPPAPATASSGDGETRLVIYRTSYAGFAVQPKVFVDGQEAAICAPGRATTVKVAPGTHRLTAKTLAEKAITVSVPEGGTSYVKCSLTVGLLVGGAKLASVPAAEAAPKAAKLKQIAAN